ncbi:MAG: NAD(P)/FAD-dependent oxidoreductase [Anaerococcus sp.]|nr:NAD(P)/FAD-dependent oxidoreductase [Anaerococcus sp.]
MYDAIIIGGGVTGSSVAFYLSKNEGKFLLLEKHEDVCCETSKANSGICHGGYDAHPGTMKAKMNVKGNQMMEELSKTLSFPYKKIGTLVLCHNKENFGGLKELYNFGIANGVKGMKIIYKDEILAMEPNVEENVYAALYCAEAGIVDPFLMNISFAEVANMNGVEFEFNKKVINIRKEDNHWLVETEDGEIYQSKTVINCAGLYSDQLHNMVSDDKFTIKARRGEYLLLDKETKGFVNHVVFNLPTNKGKGILITPTIDDNTLVGPTSDYIDDKSDTKSTREHLEEVIDKSNDTVKNVPVNMVITSFSGNRAHEVGGDFILQESVDGFFDCVGIESPGLTSAPAIGEYMAGLVKEKINLLSKENFDTNRKPLPKTSEMSLEEHENLIKENPKYGRIICRCENVTEGEIIDAINRPLGARSVDGIKRRVRATAGRCQGGFCLPRVMEILSRELGIDFEEVTKGSKKSRYLQQRVK